MTASQSPDGFCGAFRFLTMNNKLLIFAAAAMMLAGCSQMDKPAESGVPVKLSYSTVNAVETKAAQNLNNDCFASGEDVTVRISNSGAGAWADYTFITGENGAMVAPDPAPYYPAGDQNIDIAAYYPANAGESFTVAADQTADEDYKSSDLMFAKVENQAKTADAVNLAFSHKMAKLNVNITAGQGVTNITGLSVLNVKPTVSFDRAAGTIGKASGDATAIVMSNNGAAVIPAQTINGGLLEIVTDKGTATYSVADKVFEAGKLYTINITVNLRAVGATTAITGWTSEGNVTVNPVTTSRTPAGLEAVDLGLSVKWANMNVGAETETDYGTYFAWGETYGYTVQGSTRFPASGNLKTYFSWETYSLCNGSQWTLNKYNGSDGYGYIDNKTVLESGNDAASVNWGGTWRMPTKDEWAELAGTQTDTDNYTWTLCTTSYNGVEVYGWEIKYNGNGNHIFIPMAEYIMSAPPATGGNVYTSGRYWSSSLHEDFLAFSTGISSGGLYVDNNGLQRFYGLTVRAVKN